MERYQAILAYDGTDFKGFQRQAGKIGERTVQGSFESALKRVGWTGDKLLSAARTDSGVHASGQVVAFELEWNHPAGQLLAALNTYLPPDIAVRRLNLVDPDFHPRFDAVSRSYEYRIFADPVRDPKHERYAWRIWPDIELDRVQAASVLFVGKHDFRTFGTAPHTGGSTVRVVYQAQWFSEQGDRIFQIRANAFLYHMVRKLVCFLVEIGQKKHEPTVIEALLEASSPESVKGIAPACGLTLLAVDYPLKSQDH